MALLIINRSDSRCGACGKSADPHEKAHDRVLGYSPGEGCHEVFDALGSEYRGGGIEGAVKAMRPDLPWTERLG